VSLSCAETLACLGPYAAEDLPDERRRAVREHLAFCGECQTRAVAADPTLLFARPVPIEEVPAADAARILEGVRAAVALRQAERRLASGEQREPGAGHRVGRRWAAVAAALAAMALLMVVPGGPSRSRSARSNAAQTAPAATTPAFAAAASRPAGPAEIRPSGATVYEIAPGKGSNEPRVVWIVDGSLDI
jgi:hypothetical protein